MKKAFLILLLLAVTIYILPLNIRPMSIPDESRYAEIPREMIASGDWTVPHLDGMRYFEKPVFGYWANAVSILIFGENNFAIRFPSAAAAILSAIMVFLLVRKFTGSERQALLTSAALLTCVEVFAVGVFSVLDTLFAMFVTGTMIPFFFAMQEDRPKRRRLYLALAGLSCALAFLTKGFLAFALPVAAVAPLLLWERRIKEVFALAWVPILVAAIVIMPWALAIHMRESDYWYKFFYVEHVQRFFNPEGKAQHAEPAWFFLPVLAGGMFPWLLLLPAALVGLCRKTFSTPLTRFALCWFIMLFLFFSASTGKLGTYILPCFPPLMILVMDGLLKYLDGGKRKLFQAGALFAGVTGMGAAIFLILAQKTHLFENLRVYDEREAWKWMIVAAGLLALGLFAFLSVRESGATRRLACYSLAPVLLFFSVHFAIPQAFRLRAKECMDPAGMVSHYAPRIPPGGPVFSENYLVHVVCWTLKRTDINLLEGGGELENGLSYKDAKNKMLKANQFEDYVENATNTVSLISNVDDYSDYQAKLPKPFFLEITNGFVFAQFPAGKK